MIGVFLGVEIEFCRNLLVLKKKKKSKEKKEISVKWYEFRIFCVVVFVMLLRLWDIR